MIHHRGTENTERSLNHLTHVILGAAIEIHRHLGPGLLESAYQAYLDRELRFENISFESQVPLPLRYRDLSLKCGYRIDFVVERSVIVEVKATAKIHPIHRAQVLTYLKLTKLHLGLLINFNVEVLHHGIHRIINGLRSPLCPLCLCGELTCASVVKLYLSCVPVPRA
jgi:GxxExxY protein